MFLADPSLSVTTVAAADRKVVCMHDQYSNVYVSYTTRRADLSRLYGNLRAGDIAAFDELAARYGVGYVIRAADATDEDCRLSRDPLDPMRFEPVFSQGPYQVDRVRR